MWGMSIVRVNNMKRNVKYIVSNKATLQEPFVLSGDFA